MGLAMPISTGTEAICKSGSCTRLPKPHRACVKFGFGRLRISKAAVGRLRRNVSDLHEVETMPCYLFLPAKQPDRLRLRRVARWSVHFTCQTAE